MTDLRKPPSPTIAAVFAFFSPGLGQADITGRVRVVGLSIPPGMLDVDLARSGLLVDDWTR